MNVAEEFRQAAEFLLALGKVKPVGEAERQRIEDEGLAALIDIVQKGLFEKFEFQFTETLELELDRIEANRAKGLREEILGLVLLPQEALQEKVKEILDRRGIEISPIDEKRLLNALQTLIGGANEAVFSREAEKAIGEISGANPELVREAATRALQTLHDRIADIAALNQPVRILVRVEVDRSGQFYPRIARHLGDGEVIIMVPTDEPEFAGVRSLILRLMQDAAREMGTRASFKIHNSTRQSEPYDIERLSRGRPTILVTQAEIDRALNQLVHDSNRIPVEALRAGIDDLMADLAVKLAQQPDAAGRLTKQLRDYFDIRKGSLGNWVVTPRIENLIALIQNELKGLEAQRAAA